MLAVSPLPFFKIVTELLIHIFTSGLFSGYACQITYTHKEFLTGEIRKFFYQKKVKMETSKMIEHTVKLNTWHPNKS